jgi:DNA repair protein RAD57
MTDLLITLPSFPTSSYTHLLPSLEKNFITTSDLLTLDALEIAKRAQLPIFDVKRLATHILEALHSDLGLESSGARHEADEKSSAPHSVQGNKGKKLKTTGEHLVSKWKSIGLFDATLNKAVGGGIPTGYITEVTGERYVQHRRISRLYC